MKAIHARVFMTVLALLLLSGCVTVASGSSDGLSVTGLNGTCTVEIHNLEDITSITAEFDAGTGNTVSISPEGEVTVVPGESA